VASLVLAALVLVPAPIATAPAAAAAADPVRVLLVGDSVTQGSSGDWTWRYRLWQHLTSHGVAVDFVGPRADLWDNLTGAPGSTSYLDPAFDSDHAARWGMSMAFPDVPVETLVADYRPDVVVEMLGAADLQYVEIKPDRLEELTRDFVADVRSADPEVDVVLATVPKPWLPAAAEYNPRVADIARDLDTPAARVVPAYVDAGLDRVQDTWDDAHLNSWGEVRVAAAVADSLALLGVGPPADRPLALPARGPRIRSTPTARAEEGSVDLSWSRSPGATATQVWMHDETAGTPWTRLGSAPSAQSTWRVGGLVADHVLGFRTVPVKGLWAAEPDVWSEVSVVVPGPAQAAVGRPGPVSRLRLAPRRTALLARWDGPPLAQSYVVWWRRSHSHVWHSVSTAGTRALLRHLRPGVRYTVAVEPLGQAGAGPRTTPQAVRTNP
jgi:lysophospholipase L1-like esterase